MTEQQIRWAASHDWFIAVLASGEGVLVQDAWIDMNDPERKLYSDSKAFTDFRRLRDWAGY